jgi:pyruvate kinase
MKKLEKNLIDVYRQLINKEFIAKKVAENAHPDNKMSIKNLVRYVTLRTIDLREVHDHLSELGISALRSCESYVMHNVISVLKLIKILNGEDWKPQVDVETIGYKSSKKLINRNINKLFNTPKRNNRKTKIMVTMPLEAAYDSTIIRNFILHGMEIARINLSHGTPYEWEQLTKNIKTEAEELDLECNIYMDLSGPKIRTENVNIVKANGQTKSFIRLNKGDHLILTTDITKVNDNIYGEKGQQLNYPSVAVSIPEILTDTKIGDRIFFDDGMVESKVIKKRDKEIEVIVIKTGKTGFKLKSRKGINLPDTMLNLPSLTEADLEHMPFVMDNADILGYSFVRTVEDIRMIHSQMEKYDKDDIGLILKIENQESFENLPILLLEAMKKSKVGVMIARGDLAVEIGAERIAEVQDEIMWICEAAHVPVIWATQVLENLAKTGKASRAEITDAAKSARAECVMLNKGEYIDEALVLLSSILTKMEKHTSKKKSVMRALNVSLANIDKMGLD